LFSLLLFVGVKSNKKLLLHNMMNNLEGDAMSQVLELLQSVVKEKTTTNVGEEPKLGVGTLKKTTNISVDTEGWDGNNECERLVHDKDVGNELSSIDESNATRNIRVVEDRVMGDAIVENGGDKSEEALVELARGQTEIQNVAVEESVVRVVDVTSATKQVRSKRKKKSRGGDVNTALTTLVNERLIRYCKYYVETRDGDGGAEMAEFVKIHFFDERFTNEKQEFIGWWTLNRAEIKYRIKVKRTNIMGMMHRAFKSK
jgi:hypothetical protein